MKNFIITLFALCVLHVSWTDLLINSNGDAVDVRKESATVYINGTFVTVIDDGKLRNIKNKDIEKAWLVGCPNVE